MRRVDGTYDGYRRRSEFVNALRCRKSQKCRRKSRVKLTPQNGLRSSPNGPLGMTMRSRLYLCLRDLLLAMAVVAAPTSVFAQSGSLLDQLDQEDVQADLKLSTEQVEKLEAVRESLKDKTAIFEMMRKSREAKTDDECAKLREEMLSAAAERRKQAEEKLQGILSAPQYKQLQELAQSADGAATAGDSSAANPQAGGGSTEMPAEAPPEGAEVTASFGSSARGTSPQEREPDKLYFNFRYAPWSEVLAAVCRSCRSDVGPQHGAARHVQSCRRQGVHGHRSARRSERLPARPGLHSRPPRGRISGLRSH